MLALRGHHLLCQFGFRGHGYSEEFVANMHRVLGQLARYPLVPVKVVSVPDVLCAKFPTTEPSHCCDPEVIERDMMVLKRLGLRAGEIVSWAELRHRSTLAFLPDDFTTLCKTCPWLPFGYCQQGLVSAQQPPSNPITVQQIPGD